MTIRAVAVLAVMCLNVRISTQAESDIYPDVENYEPQKIDKMKTSKISEVVARNESLNSDLSQAIAQKLVDTDRTRRERNSEDEISARSRIIKRQIIKIPSSVTKLKVISSEPAPKVRPKRMPPVRHSFVSQQRKSPPRRYNTKRPSELEEDSEATNHRYRENEIKNGKRHNKKSKVFYKEVSPEEFFSDIEDFQNLPFDIGDSHQPATKHPKRHQPRRIHVHPHYEKTDVDGVDDRFPRKSTRRPEQEKVLVDVKKEYDNSAPKRYPDSTNNRPYENPEYESKYAFEDYAASNIHMKQVPSPNLAVLKVIDPPDMVKESKPNPYEGKESSGADITPKTPSPRELQTMFPQQYTSHNPFVTTNFGLEESKVMSKSYGLKKEFGNFGGKQFDIFESRPTIYQEPNIEGSEQFETTIPADSSGLHVVKPPQFGGAQGSAGAVSEFTETSRTNQRATIRDILQQDCPDHEMLGYCSSPPRYPTVQIADVATKCSDLLDVMNALVPAEPRDDLSSFSRKSSEDIDIVFEDESNITRFPFDIPERSSSLWSRSDSESETACHSEYTIIEPGYAREVTSGRWFVIVQNSDATLQKVTTDTCSSPGKPCKGLAGMKCSRNRNFHGIKSTRCIQRYTHQRLISWDPEAPNKCPRIRVFRFPTACVCHLRTM